MRFLIEFEGVLTDVAKTWYQAYRDVAEELGWARIDEATYWRLTRAKGREGNILPGAKAVKIEAYHARFAQRLDEDDLLESYSITSGAAATLTSLAEQGGIGLVTLGANVEARRRWLDGKGLSAFGAKLTGLTTDPRQRPGELATLTQGERRTVVVACTDSLVRSASAAELFTVGLTKGPCTARRLQQAGADVVYGELTELLAELDTGAGELIAAGLLPPSLG